MTTLIVDRIDGDFAVCEREDGTIIDIALSALPGDVREGAVLRVDNASIVHDAQGEENHRVQIKKRIDRLWK